MKQSAAWLMIRPHAAAACIHAPIGNHTFWATGITAYLGNGGALEHAQSMAAHESPRTTKLYDRTKEQLMQADSRPVIRRSIWRLTSPRVSALRPACTLGRVGKAKSVVPMDQGLLESERRSGTVRQSATTVTLAAGDPWMRQPVTLLSPK